MAEAAEACGQLVSVQLIVLARVSKHYLGVEAPPGYVLVGLYGSSNDGGGKLGWVTSLGKYLWELQASIAHHYVKGDCTSEDKVERKMFPHRAWAFGKHLLPSVCI